MKELLLASASPRRKQLLAYFGYPFKILTHQFEEEAVTLEECGNDPARYVQRIAEGKVAGIKLRENQVVIGADSSVFFEGKMFNKPQDLAEARRFVQAMLGKEQIVYTGVCVKTAHKIFSDVVATRIVTRQLDDFELDRYLAKIDPLDKAGGYTVEGIGSLLVERIDGCPNNILGLPLQTVDRLCKEAGLDLWRAAQ